LDGVAEIESWDETYVHSRLNADKTVLSVRVDGDHEEPWTWVRDHGQGRVFYTAWGHDSRTWSNEGFRQLLERGIRWSAGDWALDAEFLRPELAYEDGMLPYYPPGERWGVLGEPVTRVQKPLSPEQSREHVVVEPGFRVELFASEDDVINPIDMAWDERGRLWVTETVDYPNSFTDDRRGNDRIKILEDTNGDGRSDKVTVFAGGLNIPTSLVLVNGGVIVSQAPDFLFLKDTTGDDKADYKEVLFTGWGTFDTHAGPSNLQYGFDNQIWGTVGYSAFEGTVGGEEHRFSSGIYRFKPDGSKLEYISNTNNNTWGLGFNEDGSVFASTANNHPIVSSVVPNRFYGSSRPPRLNMISDTNLIYPLPDSVLQVDQHGRYTAGSGLHIYTAREFPKDYWNRVAFVSEPTGHLLGKFIVERNGSDYKARNAWNMLSSLDTWFSPIQSKVGPDGALWVLDWYNPIIQHNPTPEGFESGAGNAYVSGHRDTQHARIYRVVHEEGHHRTGFNLEGATVTELLNALGHDNLFWRQTAQRLLVERGQDDVFPRLYAMVEDKSTDELGLNPGALHALWTLHGLGGFDAPAAEALEAGLRALHHPASSVRRAALMVLPRNRQVLDAVLDADFVSTADPHVRLAALLALAEMPVSGRAGAAIAGLLLSGDNASDLWIRDASAAAGSRHQDSFLKHVLQRGLQLDADSTHNANIAVAVRRVAGHYAGNQPSGASMADYLALLEHADAIIGVAFVSGLNSGWPEAGVPDFNGQEREALQRLRTNLPEFYDETLNELHEKWGYH
ncbi:MAG: PVC-type heme-binding CxxCH protein, partial [Balneolales bacterium]